MRIAILLPSLENRGPIIFSEHLIVGLLQLNCEIDVYYFKESIEKVNLNVPCIKINIFTIKSFKEYDVVHSTMALPDLYVFLHRYIIKAKHVISMHNFIAEDIGMLYNSIHSFLKINIWKMSLGSKSNYIYSSNYMKKYYDEYIGEFCSKVIPYGISTRFDRDIDKVDQDFLIKLKSNYTVIGSVGLIIKRKGFYQLIDLLTLNQKLAVVIIGIGDMSDELLNLAIKKGVNDRFHILGFKENSSRYYKYFDVFAMVSFSEGFGMAMIESLAHSLPLLCSNLPIYRDIIPDDSVCFFEPGNIDDLNIASRKLLSSIEVYKSLSFKLYCEKFSRAKMAESHLAFYSELINNN